MNNPTLSFVQQLKEEAPLRQGDIICREYRENSTEPYRTELGVIITADCDIAQDKMGPFFSYVSIISLEKYLTDVWAFEEVQRLRTRHSQAAITAIALADRRRDPEVNTLEQHDLVDWLQSSGATAIIEAVCLSEREQKNALVSLRIVEIIEKTKDTDCDLLQTLLECWTVQGKSEKEQRSLLAAAAEQRQMRMEYLLLPALPSVDGLGFVILLRDVRSISIGEMYRSRLDFRLRSAGVGMFRLGRFSDALRYLVSQRLAFLFSRIGMPRSFEIECESAADLVMESLLHKTFRMGVEK